MTTLLDMMQREVPASIELVGKRLSGTVEVTYARSSHLTPVIRFGSERFGVHTSVVTANSIECEIAGEAFYRNPDGSWSSDTFKNVRRNIDYRSGGPTEWDVPYKTWAMIRDALAAECPRLYEQFPGAFAKLGTATGYAHGAGFGGVIERLKRDAELVQAWDTLYRLIEDGEAVVLQRHGDRLPEEIRWETPSSETLHNHDIQKGRGRVVGAVISNDLHGGLLGYAIDCSGTPYKPDCYHGPLLVPVDLARHL